MSLCPIYLQYCDQVLSPSWPIQCLYIFHNEMFQVTKLILILDKDKCSFWMIIQITDGKMSCHPTLSNV